MKVNAQMSPSGDLSFYCQENVGSLSLYNHKVSKAITGPTFGGNTDITTVPKGVKALVLVSTMLHFYLRTEAQAQYVIGVAVVQNVMLHPPHRSFQLIIPSALRLSMYNSSWPVTIDLQSCNSSTGLECRYFPVFHSVAPDGIQQHLDSTALAPCLSAPAPYSQHAQGPAEPQSTSIS